MAAKLVCVLLVLMCCTVFGNTTASDPWDNAGVRAVLRIYDECSKTESISPCLKKKAITFLDRLSRMAKLPLSDEIVIVEADDAPTTPQQNLTDEELENSLPRDAEGRDSALDNLLYDKISSYVSSRTLRVTMPRISIASLGLPEGRRMKMKGMMGQLMMGIAGKMAAMIPIAIAGLFLLAGKALITAKIALLISGIIALKKLVAAKQGGGGGHGGGWQSSGHGGGWHSSGGGGWDRRSMNDASNLAYKAYVPK